ncbi:MAG: branched-chain amino acid ABC transporter permease [Clostridiaceae bacterium]
MKKYIKPISFLALILAVYFILNPLIASRTLSNQAIGVIMFICINIILATSLNLITGFTGQLCLGHAGFMSIGAYFSAILSVKLHLPFLLGLVAGGLLAGLISLLIGIPTLKLKGDYFAITTLGFGEIIKVIMNNIDTVGGAKGLSVPKSANFTIVYFVMIISVIVIYNIIRSSYGRAMISVRENEIAAEAMGVNTSKYKIMAFVIAAFFAGVAGGLYAHYNTFIQPTSFDFLKSVEIVTFVVFGGMGSLSGSILAAGVLTILPEALRSINDLRMIIYSVALIVLMLFRPQGLLGTKEISLKVFGDLFNKKTKNPSTISKGE